MKKIVLCIFAAFLVFDVCYARRHSFHRRSSTSKNRDFFNPQKFLNEDQKKTQLELSISNNRQELEKSQLRHQIEMEKLKQQQLNQKYQIEKENLQKKLEILKLQKEIRELEKK